MLLNKASLAVAAFASDDASRPNLCGVLVDADGTTTATNGHCLARMSPCPLSVEDFPEIPGLPRRPGQPTLTPFILPSADAKSIAKAIPKRMAIPLLEAACLDVDFTNENGLYRIGITDLDAPQIRSGRKVEGEFPDVSQVLPKRPAAISIRIDVGYLKAVAAVASSLGCRSIVLGVDDENSALRFECTTATGQTFSGLVMPQRL
jgi:hypothetical protein